jgi:preprotein translocase SecE subunit
VASDGNVYSPSYGWRGIRNRPVALIGRASDSKSECWGFESLLACINLLRLMFSKAIGFLNEVRAEVKKVTWPSRKEAMGGTAVVVFVVLVMALFLGVVDAILSKAVQGLIKI